MTCGLEPSPRRRGRRARPARARARSWAFCCLLAAPCCSQARTGSPPPAAPPRVAPTAEDAPGLGPAPRWKPPELRTSRLENGLQVRWLPSREASVVAAELMLLSGSASDDDRPGRSELCARAAALSLAEPGDGAAYDGELARRVEVQTSPDSTRFRLTLAPEEAGAALSVLAALAETPELAEGKFDRLVSVARQRALARARQNETWVAEQALLENLFRSPHRQHPYAHWSATSEQLARIGRADCKQWLAGHVAPGNAVLLLAGALPAKVASAARRAFATWRGQPPPPPDYFPPPRNSLPRVLLVDRPGSPQSEILVSALTVPRRSPAWPAVEAAKQLLGAHAGRLHESLVSTGIALRASAMLHELAQGPCPLVLRATVRIENTPRAAEAMARELDRIATERPTSASLRRATQALRYSRALAGAGAAHASALLGTLGRHSLADDYPGKYLTSLAALSPFDVLTASRGYLEGQAPLVVVAGDAARLADPLSRLGQVEWIDPEQEFRLDRVITHNPDASPEVR